MAKKLNVDNNVYLKNDSEDDYGSIIIEKKEPPKDRGPLKSSTDKKKKAKSIGKTIWAFLRPVVMVVIALAVVGGVAYYIYGSITDKYFSPIDPADSAVIEVEIPKSSSLSTISQILYDNGLIRNTTVFKLYADFTDKSHKLKAGTYELSKNMTYDDMLYTMMKGEPPRPVVDVTLTEGMTIENMAEIFVEKGVFENSAEFLEMCRTGEAYNNISYVSDITSDPESQRNYVLEGYLFPDTYNCYQNSDADTIISRMLARFDEIMINDYVNRADEMGMTMDEVITLASIIEKEAKPQEFKKVSAVFHNRLNSDMPLQSCATMQVVTGLNKYTFTDEELATDSPYNTYMYKGLPEGPICNPGKNAIEAALYPDEEFMQEGYLYFCLTTPETGEQAYAKTYDEHLKNVREWEEYWN